MSSYGEFGLQMKRERLLRRLTVTDLAESIGVTRDSVYRWEIGERLPRTPEVFDRWLHALGVRVDVKKTSK
jgi:transcriptional regulator with XRE-family HTH domain